jgi:hypothetical protein
MERAIFYGLLWSLIAGAFGMLQFTVALWANPRPSAIVAHISAYIAVVTLCVFVLREARAAKPNRIGGGGRLARFSDS